MNVVFPFCKKDSALLERLLVWIEQLGGARRHSAVLIADGSVSFDEAVRLRILSDRIFGTSRLIGTVPIDGWIRGSNTLFKLAATKLIDRPFLWVEPDAVPTREGWLGDIETEFQKEPSKFLGAVVHHDSEGLPNPYLEGCAVYPAGAWKIMEPSFNLDQSWTLACAKAVVPLSRNSPLFQHFWGKPGVVPTFVPNHAQMPANGLPLSHVRKETALFHRNKDGSLIKLLEQKLFPSRKKIIVVFPVCSRDVDLAIMHATWLQRMGRKSAHCALISADAKVPSQTVERMRGVLEGVFSAVSVFQYPTPQVRYPFAANLAWQHTARHMQRLECPWLWCEADAVALKPDWIEQLQAEYDRAGKPWMGVVVPSMGHLQGTAIYPADAATKMLRAMASTQQAFDVDGKQDVNGQVHDASHLIFHVWSMQGGNPSPVGGGELPRAITAAQLQRWLPKSAVFMHRVKDNSVLSLLMSGAVKP